MIDEILDAAFARFGWTYADVRDTLEEYEYAIAQRAAALISCRRGMHHPDTCQCQKGSK